MAELLHPDENTPQHMAMDWAIRRLVGGLSPEETHAFEQWRQADAAHALAYDKALDFCQQLRALPLEAAPAKPRASFVSRRGLIGGLSVAACAAGAAVVVAPSLRPWEASESGASALHTGPSQQQSLTPVAGVGLELNTRTRISMKDGGRRVQLKSGEVFATVSAREQPFEIQSGRLHARSHEGSLSVQAHNQHTYVTCVSGEATCVLDGKQEVAAPGERLKFTGTALAARERIDPDTTLAWRRGLVIFRATPLSAAVAELNRYYPGRLIVADSGLGEKRVSGTFHIRQIELTVPQLQTLLGVNATRLPGNIILLG